MEELLTYFPYRYVDRSHIFRIDEIDGAMPYILLQGRFSNFQEVGKGTRGHRITAWFSDETGTIECVWFKGLKYVANISTEKQYIIFGKPQPFNGRLNITHPDLESIKGGEEAEDYEGLMPMYNTTEAMKRAGMTTKAMAKIIASALETHKAPFAETLPAYLMKSSKWMWVTFVPAIWMTFVCTTYILVAPEALELNYTLGVCIGGAVALTAAILGLVHYSKVRQQKAVKE